MLRTCGEMLRKARKSCSRERSKNRKIDCDWRYGFVFRDSHTSPLAMCFANSHERLRVESFPQIHRIHHHNKGLFALEVLKSTCYDSCDCENVFSAFDEGREHKPLDGAAFLACLRRQASRTPLGMTHRCGQQAAVGGPVCNRQGL